MTDKRARGYGTGQPQEIVDRSDLRKWRIEVPNLVDDAELDVYEFRLLVHYKRVGSCFEGTGTTAKKCHMSQGKVSQARASLKAKGWIDLDPTDTPTGPGFRVTVVDKWEENFAHYSSRRKPSPHEGSASKPSLPEGYSLQDVKAEPSPHEGEPSPHETKKEQELKKQPIQNLPSAPGPGAGTTAIEAAYELLIGHPLTKAQWIKHEAAAAKTIGESFTVAQLEAAYKHYKAGDFWDDKRLTLKYLAENMPEWAKMIGRQDQRRAQAARPLTAPIDPAKLARIKAEQARIAALRAER